MNALLDLYELPYNPAEPVIGLDEKSKQLLEHSRKPIPLTPGYGIREDSEYIRKGTCNLFVAVEPKGNKRYVKVTSHRTKQDFACFARELVENEYNQERNMQKKGIEWSFTKEKAAAKFKLNTQQN